MEYFVQPGSVVRKIWADADTILFIFAGAAAEFALNKAVDWLYFTGRLPADPLGRLFSTVSYARKIVFAEKNQAIAAIRQINQIHAGVENKRNAKIPDWAYRDVLFMLIHYSIAAFELMERKMNDREKEEVYNVFYRMGIIMDLKELPADYKEWLPVRQQHMENNMVFSPYTADLYQQYKKHLGAFRYWLLLEGQIMVVPGIVKNMLGLRSYTLLSIVLFKYKILKKLRLSPLVKSLVLPAKYKKEFKALDIKTASL